MWMQSLSGRWGPGEQALLSAEAAWGGGDALLAWRPWGAGCGDRDTCLRPALTPEGSEGETSRGGDRMEGAGVCVWGAGWKGECGPHVPGVLADAQGWGPKVVTWGGGAEWGGQLAHCAVALGTSRGGIGPPKMQETETALLVVMGFVGSQVHSRRQAAWAFSGETPPPRVTL